MGVVFFFKITRHRDKYYYYVGKTLRTSSRLMTSIWSFLWKSSHSSLYLSISSLVCRIFFFSTSNSEPCCMVVMVTSRRVEETHTHDKRTKRPGKPRTTHAAALVRLSGEEKRKRSAAGQSLKLLGFRVAARRGRILSVSGKIGRTTGQNGEPARVWVTDGRQTQVTYTHANAHWVTDTAHCSVGPGNK